MRISLKMKQFECLIIGGGPAGYTAGIYACRAGLQTALVEGPEPGGQLTTTSLIENYPGFENGVNALQLMSSMRKQTEKLGTEIISGEACRCDLQQKEIYLKSGESIKYKALVIATGASAKYLGIEGEKRFKGMGVSACATCDGFFFKDKIVAVVGGGDTACEDAMYLSGIAKKVYMIVRKDYLRASDAMQKKVKATGNIEILFNTVTKELLGDALGLTTAKLSRNGEDLDLAIDGFFLAIGRHPNTEWLDGALPLNDNGYIISDGVKTTISGVYVAGDVRNTDYRQAITAAADGCRAALEAEKYIKDEI